MASERPPRTTPTAKRTTTSTTIRAPRAAKTIVSAPSETPAALKSTIPQTAEPVSTPQATLATTAIQKGNAGIDLDAVRRRAYELYEERGRLDGFHEQDWYTAMAELSGRKQSRSQNGRTSEDAKRGPAKRKDSQRSA